MTYGPDPKDGTNDYDGMSLGERTARRFGTRLENTMARYDTPDMIQKRIERHQREADRLEARLAKLEALPQEPDVEDGEPNVIWFTKVFQNGSRVYTYAAVKCGDGLWYTSGPSTPKGYLWLDLVQWIYDGESAEIWWASAFDPIGPEFDYDADE